MDGQATRWRPGVPADIRHYDLDHEALTRSTQPVYFVLGSLSNPDD